MHEEHACKESSKKLSSLIELLKHIASKYFKESDEESEMKVQSEVVESENENKVFEKDKPFVFSESMLDEFL